MVNYYHMWYWTAFKLFLYSVSLAKIHECISTRKKQTSACEQIHHDAGIIMYKDFIPQSMYPIQHSPFKSTSSCQFPWIKHLWNVSIMCLFQNYKMLFAWLCIYFTTINSPWAFIWKNHCLQEVNTSKYSWILYLIILLFL